MTFFHTSLMLWCAGLCLVPARLVAQSATQLVEGGVRAYGDLDFGTAAGLLRRGLGLPDSAFGPGARSRALSYLAAAEQFRGNPDSAAAAFRRLVILDPRYRPDQLIFPPEVVAIFEAERLKTKTVRLSVPADARLQLGRESFAIRAYASSFHEIAAELTRAAGGSVRTVYRGPIGDSLVLRWDGRDAAGDAVPSGAYLLAVSSLDARGQALRLVQVPLDIERQQRDTVPAPFQPADSLFLPERATRGPGIEALVGGLLAATSVFVLPRALAPGSEISSARLVIAGGLSVAGIAGFLARYPGRSIPRNIEANRLTRQRWSEQAESVRLENAERRRDARLIVRTGAAVQIERDQP